VSPGVDSHKWTRNRPCPYAKQPRSCPSTDSETIGIARASARASTTTLAISGFAAASGGRSGAASAEVLKRHRRRLQSPPPARQRTYAYLDETVYAVEDTLKRLNVSAGSYYESVQGLFFHRPYHLMPVQATAFLYVRGLARGDHHQVASLLRKK
jgi:hypothetical protein